MGELNAAEKCGKRVVPVDPTLIPRDPTLNSHRSDLLPPIRRLLHVSRSQAGAEPCMVIGLNWGLMTRRLRSVIDNLLSMRRC